MEPPNLIRGDSREILPTLPGDSADTVVTDPPYGLGFMSRPWDSGSVTFSVPFWAEVLRVTKPGGYLLAFGGTRTWHRLACAIEDAGWLYLDTLCWLYGQGMPKGIAVDKALDKQAGAKRPVIGTRKKLQSYSTDNLERDGGPGVYSGKAPDYGGVQKITAPATEEAKRWAGWNTGIKPAWEPILLAMKPPQGTFAENAQAHGVAGFWVDGCRIGEKVETWPASRRHHGANFGQCHGQEGATQATGPPPPGRWPANVVLEHHPDCGEACHPECPVRLLDEQSGVLNSGREGKGGHRQNGQNQRSVYGNFKGYQARGILYGDSGGAARFMYCAKASRKERGEGNTHPTVKPVALCRWLCRLTRTPSGGVVLDPFAGTGSVGLAAVLEGRGYIGIEQSPTYYATMLRRFAELGEGEP